MCRSVAGQQGIGLGHHQRHFARQIKTGQTKNDADLGDAGGVIN